MQKPLIYVAVLIGTASSPSLAEDPRLRVSADTPRVEIDERQVTRRGIALPAMPLSFRVDAGCPAPQAPVSLTLSIADSRTRLPADEIDAAIQSGLAITVPASQIAPVFLQDFCNGEDSRRQATVPGLLSAQVSLSCASENEPVSSVKYASVGVDVTLACLDGDGGPATTAKDAGSELLDR